MVSPLLHLITSEGDRIDPFENATISIERSTMIMDSRAENVLNLRRERLRRDLAHTIEVCFKFIKKGEK